MQKGSCLCGAVEFEITGEADAPTACHCDECRKSSSHYFASCHVQKDELKIAGEENISWFQSSKKARRGFCLMCGSPLFFDPIFEDGISVSMGAMDKPTALKLAKHIYTGEKGDYYEICDDLPQS